MMVVGVNESDREYLNYLSNVGYIIEHGPTEGRLQEYILRNIPNVLLLGMDTLGDRVLDIVAALKDNPMTYTMPITIVVGKRSLAGEISALEAGAEDYLKKPIVPEILAARIDTILRRNTRLQISNPLTGLPGSLYIEEQITRRLQNNLPLAVCYADLDNFKAFNDKYGYARGDNVIRIVATILNESVSMFGRKGDFVGHIGGDDFVIILHYDCVEEVCDYVVNSFDTLIPFQYDDEDMVKGYIEAESRQRQIIRFPIMTVSIGVVTNRHRQLQSFLKISELSAEMKEYAKSISKDQSVRKSSYRIDQRAAS
jgi:diguanylate cyclase (GGDEF)-like protein